MLFILGTFNKDKGQVGSILSDRENFVKDRWQLYSLQCLGGGINIQYAARYTVGN